MFDGNIPPYTFIDNKYYGPSIDNSYSVSFNLDSRIELISDYFDVDVEFKDIFIPDGGSLTFYVGSSPIFSTTTSLDSYTLKIPYFNSDSPFYIIMDHNISNPIFSTANQYIDSGIAGKFIVRESDEYDDWITYNTIQDLDMNFVSYEIAPSASYLLKANTFYSEYSVTNDGNFIKKPEASLITPSFENNGYFQGGGLIEVAKFTNNGVLAPGNSPGLAQFSGDFTQNAEGKLQIELFGNTQGAANGYDFLDIEGTATLDGSLEILLGYGFDLKAGNTFTILQAAILQDTFKNIINPHGWNFLVEYLDLDGTLEGADTVRLTARAVPIPGAALLLGGSLLGIIGFRRKFAA